MPRIISFAWTTPALLLGHKTCTRRAWDDGYVARFRVGDEMLAYDRSPRARGSRVALLRLIQEPVLQPMSDMPDSDYDAEGFSFMSAHPEVLTRTVEGLPRDHFIRDVLSREGFARWRSNGQYLWVIRFRLLSLTPEGERQKALHEHAMLASQQKVELCRTPSL